MTNQHPEGEAHPQLLDQMLVLVSDDAACRQTDTVDPTATSTDETATKTDNGRRSRRRADRQKPRRVDSGRASDQPLQPVDAHVKLSRRDKRIAGGALASFLLLGGFSAFEIHQANVRGDNREINGQLANGFKGSNHAFGISGGGERLSVYCSPHAEGTPMRFDLTTTEQGLAAVVLGATRVDAEGTVIDRLSDTEVLLNGDDAVRMFATSEDVRRWCDTINQKQPDVQQSTTTTTN